MKYVLVCQFIFGTFIFGTKYGYGIGDHYQKRRGMFFKTSSIQLQNVEVNLCPNF